MPKVSIVVPIYNVEEYLDLALESVKRQTLKDIEIICVNDGSTDSSLEIIKKWADGDDRFVIIDKKNGGYGVAMNTGIARATGEYIGILEPDDLVPLHMFEDLYQIAVDNDLDFVKADFYRFTTRENGNVRLFYNRLTPWHADYDYRVIDPREEPQVLAFIMNTWSGIYKRSFLEENNIQHNTTPGASFQDNGFFWQTMIYARRIMFVNKPYYMNRRDNPNSSVNNKGKVYAANVEYDFIRDILMDNDPEIWETFKYYYTLKKFDNYMFTLSRIADEFEDEYIDRFQMEMKRAIEQGEFDWSVFDEKKTEFLKLLLKNKSRFRKVFDKDQYETHLTAAQRVKHSRTYRIGRAVTFVPRKVKKILKPNKKGKDEKEQQ